jgi:hypothetical protein
MSLRKVDMLITLDPVSLFTPSYAAVAANTNAWYDYNAVGGAIVESFNIIAGFAGDWGQPVSKFTSYYANVNLDHGTIGSALFISHLIGP